MVFIEFVTFIAIISGLEYSQMLLVEQNNLLEQKSV